MADQRRLLEAVLPDKVKNVGCHGVIVVLLVVGRLAMVAEVLRQNKTKHVTLGYSAKISLVIGAGFTTHNSVDMAA